MPAKGKSQAAVISKLITTIADILRDHAQKQREFAAALDGMAEGLVEANKRKRKRKDPWAEARAISRPRRGFNDED